MRRSVLMAAVLPGGADPAHQQILDLATADEWDAVYDPTNASTVTLRAGEFVTTLADGLGNLPSLVQAVEAGQPTLSSVGKLTTALWPVTGNPHLTMESDLSPDWSQPTTIFTLFKLPDNLATRFIFAGENIARRQDFLATSSAWGANAGTLISTTDPAPDANPHIACVEFNGASSEIWLDGVSIHTGNLGAHVLRRLRIGNNVTTNATPIEYNGISVLKNDIVTDAVRNRMFALLHELSGIPSAA